MSKKGKARPKKSSAKAKKKVSSKKIQGFWSDSKKHLLILFVFAFVLYGNTLFHDYTQDDAIVIVDNDFTKKGIAGIPKILTEDTFYGFFGEKKDLVAGGRYRPLSLVTFAFEYQFFGETPFIGHLGNIVLYGLTGILIYLIVLLLLDKSTKKSDYFNYVIGFGTALLFLAHPIHTEAVANIKGRDEIMSLLGSLAALYFVVRGHRENNNKFLILSGVMFFLGLLSKENAITFLAIIPMALYLFVNVHGSKLFKLVLPALIASVVFIGIRTSILGGISVGDPPMELMNNPYLKIQGGTYVPFTGSEKLSTITFTLGKYLQLLVAPITLTHDYYPKHIDLMFWNNWKVLLSLLAYIGLISAFFLFFKKRPIISFAILFFLASLSIVSNVVFPIGTHMSERFMYMPSVGFALAVTYLFYLLGKGRREKDEIISMDQMKVPALLFLVIIGLFTVKTIHRNLAWKDNYTLFLTDSKTSTNSAKLQNSVGGEIIAEALRIKNEATLALPDANDKNQLNAIDQQFQASVSTAVPHLLEAARIHPTYANPYLQLGNAHNYLKKFDEAFSYYNQALAYKNPYEEATKNMGITYKDAGQYYGETVRDFPKAISYLNEALKYETNDLNDVNRLLALCYASIGQVDKAINMLTELLEKDPNNSNHYRNLAAMYAQRGQATNNPDDMAKAEEYNRRAEQLK